MEEVIGSFLGIDNFKLVNTNRGNHKWYASLYRDFLQEIQIPDWYLDYYYNSAFVKHFYTPEEIAGFREKWSKPGNKPLPEGTDGQIM